MTSTFTLTLCCPERPGIVHAVTRFLLEHACDITEHQQFDDIRGGHLYLRTTFACVDEPSVEDLTALFAPIADSFAMDFRFFDSRSPRIVAMVSRFGHCLNDLIYRWRAGNLGGDLVAVVSNHEDLRPMAEAAGLPFHHLPVSPGTKDAAERALFDLIEEHRGDLVVLARYMQVLSDGACAALAGRAINIHHSFLPGFKGAKPYHQAYDRGVKLVGATAHYVTPDLDEGPIIEQEVIRIDHSYTPDRLVTVGRDAEAVVLSRAVRWHCEHRVLLGANGTVVFT